MTTHYVSGTAAGPGAGDAFFTILTNQLIAQGWTAIDVISNIANNRDIVYKGTNLDSTAQNAPYVRIRWVQASNAGVIEVIGMMDYDTSSHTMIASTNNVGAYQSGIIIQDLSFTYWIRANGVSCGVVTKTSSNYNKAYFGYWRRSLVSQKGGITKTTSPLTSTTTVLPVASDMTTKLQPNQVIHIYNYAHNSSNVNKTNVEYKTIQSVTSTQITLTSGLSNNYDSGALVGWQPNPICSSNCNANTIFSSASYRFYTPMWQTGAIGGAGGSYGILDYILESYGPVNQPHPTTQEYLIGYYGLRETDTGGSNQAGKGNVDGQWGTLYHFGVINNNSGSFASEDTLADSVNQWIGFSVGSGNNADILGPTNN